jgi:hypothetical protein
LLTNPSPYINSSATSINDSGEVVGEAYESDGVAIAIEWNGQTPTLLDPELQFAAQVVGNVTTPYENSLAVIWNNGEPTYLPGPGPVRTQITREYRVLAHAD